MRPVPDSRFLTPDSQLSTPKIVDTRPNYLVIRLSSIGDIVHALPAVSALGETFPQAQITWVVEDRYAKLLEGNPFVRHTIVVDTLGWRRRLASVDTAYQVFHAVQSLRERSFDAVIDFQGLVKSGVMAALCRSRLRVGFARPWLKERAAGIFYNRSVRAGSGKHAIEENLALVGSIGARGGTWRFPLPEAPEYEAQLDRLLRKENITEFIIINPGGGWAAKRWHPSNYAELIRRMDPFFPGQFVITGSPSEAPEIRQIIAASGSHRAHYFPTELSEFIALARRATLFVGGDTGPLHLAAAAGTPIVALYGPTDPARNGPFSPEDITLSTHEPVNHTRRAKHPRFLDGISVADVVEAVHRRLARMNE